MNTYPLHFTIFRHKWKILYYVGKSWLYTLESKRKGFTGDGQLGPSLIGNNNFSQRLSSGDFFSQAPLRSLGLNLGIHPC